MKLRIRTQLDQKAIDVVDVDKGGEVLLTIQLKGALSDSDRDKLVQALATWVKWRNVAEVFR